MQGFKGETRYGVVEASDTSKGFGELVGTQVSSRRPEDDIATAEIFAQVLGCVSANVSSRCRALELGVTMSLEPSLSQASEVARTKTSLHSKQRVEVRPPRLVVLEGNDRGLHRAIQNPG